MLPNPPMTGAPILAEAARIGPSGASAAAMGASAPIPAPAAIINLEN